MKRRALIFLLLAGLPLPVAAADPASAPDPRIRIVDYDANRVVRLAASPRAALQVIFGDGEAIQHVALGQPTAWEVAAEGPVLFIKPRGTPATSNLLVSTSTGTGRGRHYAFELAPLATKPAERAVFVLRFRYPSEEADQLSKALTAEALALEQKILQLKLERGAIEGPRNLDYELQGDFSLSPSEVSDNGRFTVMRFPASQALAAIYVVDEDGGERLAQFDVRGEFVVIHETSTLFRLRRGRQVLCIRNRAPGPAAAATGTLTASPEVERSLAPKP